MCKIQSRKEFQVKKTGLSPKVRHRYGAGIRAEAVTMKWPLLSPDCPLTGPKEPPFLFPCDWLDLLSRISWGRHVSSRCAQRTAKPHGKFKFGSEYVNKFLYVNREKSLGYFFVEGFIILSLATIVLIF